MALQRYNIIYYAMVAFVSDAARTGPALVSMGRPLNPATPEVSVLSSGWTCMHASQQTLHITEHPRGHTPDAHTYLLP